MGIYKLMEEDWKVYCIMSAIIYIEEMSKPAEKIQIKRYKDKVYRCLSFSSVRLKMKDPEFVLRFFEITRNWEDKKKIKLIGKTFDAPRKENFSGQDVIYFSAMWVNYILEECGRIPNKYSFDTAIKRIENFKQFERVPVDKNKFLLDILFEDKVLAAGVFVVSFDLEFRGIQSGRPALCMSEKYYDFLKFMLLVAKKWGWTNNKSLSSVSVEHSLSRGINASPQFEFRINMVGLREIYTLSGPLANSDKDKCINFHVERSGNYVNIGGGHKIRNPKQKLLSYMKNNRDQSTTDLQFFLGVGVDVVLNHLNSLEKSQKLKKERRGKRFIWNLK